MTKIPLPEYLLVKRGLYWRPDSQGYTGIKKQAGRYFETDASPDSGTTAIHESEAADFSPACWPETIIQCLQDDLARKAASADRLAEAAESLLARMFGTYTARNGRQVGIQGDDGEKCWIVHSDDIETLRQALNEWSQS